MSAVSQETPGGLKKELSLSDLLIFGITTILGSGAANLTGPAVLAAGKYYPAVIAAATGLLLGSSKTFEVAHEESRTNNSGVLLIKDELGEGGQMLAGGAYLAYNVFAVAVGLIFITRIFFPDSSAAFQVMLAIQLAVLIVVVASFGIDVNRRIVDFAGVFFALLLGGAGIIGVHAAATGTHVQNLGTALPNIDVGRALLYVFFILAGVDIVMTFTEEAKDSDDIPRAFYGSILLSAILLLGAAFAFVVLVPLRGREETLRTSGNFLADIVEAWWGKGERWWMNWVVAAFILMGTFVQYVGTSRWIYSEIGEGNWWRDLNAAAAPQRILVALGAAIMGVVMINNVDRLVGLADISLIVIMGLVGWCATRTVWKKGERVPWVEGGTTVGLMGMFGLAIREVWKSANGLALHPML